MDNESIVINVPYLFQKNKEKMKEYNQRPEVKARRKEYDKKRYQLIKEKQRKYSKLWYQRNKERQQEYRKKSYQLNKELELKNSKLWYQRNKERQQEYKQRPEVKARRKENYQKPEIKARKREYDQKPEVKARRREYDKKRCQLNKEKKQKQRELQSGYVSTLEQNFELSNFNCDDMCSEQIKNIAWDVLEGNV